MINFKDFKKEGNVKFKLSKVFPEPMVTVPLHMNAVL